jgi:hypothetical protein
VNWRWGLLAPLVVQVVASGFDELYFHRRRGLGTWERIGHPFDTLTVLACMAWAMHSAPDARGIAVYVGLAIVSSLAITKDEWVHARACSPSEHWLHALLFVTHPLGLISFGLLWPALHVRRGASLDGWADAASIAPWLYAQFALTLAFCLHQIVYWNVPWPDVPSRTG